MNNKSYIAVVQCHIVKQRCSGYQCEQSFNERKGGFDIYPKMVSYRTIYLDCGGCCGKAVLRKLDNLSRMLKEEENIGKDQIAVQLSSCITKDNYHSPPCPHIDFIKTQIQKLGLEYFENTYISEIAEKRRKKGIYQS